MADQESLKAENNNAGKKDVSKGIVLVIDDNQDVRDYVKSLLEGEYSVMEAGNGEEGLKLQGLCEIVTGG